MMVPNTLDDHCTNCDNTVKWAYWSCLTFLLYNEIQRKEPTTLQDNQKLTTCINDLLVTQNEYRPIAYWLWHDLLDILDFMAPEDQDWIDEITLEDENEKILEIIMQPNQFCQTCWYWLDLIVNGIDEVDR